VPAAHKKHFEVTGAGHYGIFSGRRWRDIVYPTVKAFIKSYQPAGAMPATTAPKTSVAAPSPKAVTRTRGMVPKLAVKAVVAKAMKTTAKAKAVVKKAAAKPVRAKAKRKA